jgi:hypothetical protein
LFPIVVTRALDPFSACGAQKPRPKSTPFKIGCTPESEQEIELAKRINGGGQDAEDAEPQVIEATCD